MRHASGNLAVKLLIRPTSPAGLAWLPTEGTGEVQTPLRGPGTASLRVGDRVWFRHAKSGEICEHVNELHTLDGDRLTGAWATYRGEGKAFG